MIVVLLLRAMTYFFLLPQQIALMALPGEVLEMLFKKLSAKDVRSVCVELQTTYDNQNTKLLIVGVGGEQFVSTQINGRIATLLRNSPMVSDVQVTHGYLNHVLPHLPKLKHLTRLDISRNKLGYIYAAGGSGGAGAPMLASSLQSLTSLHTLDIGYNNLGEAGARALAPALQCLTSLQTLGMTYNLLEAAGAAAMVPALQSLIRLQTLDISYNYLGKAGAAVLVPALQSLTSLQTLDISYNFLGEAGATSLAPALQTLTSLQKLDISQNWLSEECARAALGPSLYKICNMFE